MLAVYLKYVMEGGMFVADMALYVICSSLILVIHDNITNETNNIVEHVFVDISRSQG
jgi:Tfp pilus assembly protein PilZ